MPVWGVDEAETAGCMGSVERTLCRFVSDEAVWRSVEHKYVCI